MSLLYYLGNPGSGGTAPIPPSSLFTGGRLGDHWDAFTISNLKQLSDGTTNVAASGDPVGYMVGQINNNHFIQAVVGQRPIYRPGYLEFTTGNSQNLIVNASTAGFKFLHDGTGSTILVAARFGVVADPNTLYGLISTAGANATHHGVVCWWDDRASSGRNEALVYQIYNGTAGIIQQTINDAIPSETDVCISIRLASANTPDMTAEVGGDQVGTANASGAFSVSDSTHNLAIGGLQGGGSSPMTGRIYACLVIDRVLSDAEIAGWAAWVDARMP